jgi:hypothetical protein
MEALEALLALRGGSLFDDDADLKYDYTAAGKRYISARS